MRIDQAMRHLSSYLGRPVSRDIVEWRWTEKIFPDTSLDCPFEEIVYSQQQTRGFQVWITVDNLEYDYRVSADGNKVILCLAGRPDTSSIGIVFPENSLAEVEDFVVQPLTPSAWWAWAYVIETDTLYLLNPSGEQVMLPRPRLPNELPGSSPKLAFSRDGRYLIVAARLNTGIMGIGIYALQTGNFVQVHQVRPNEEVHLGFGYDNSAISGSPYIAGEQNRMVAVGLANTDFLTPTWRIVIFDFSTGNALYQLENTSPQVTALGTSYADGSIVFPRIVYFGEDAVHVQLIRFGAGAAESYPAFVWHPNANFAEPSPFSFTNIDILPADTVPAFTYRDESAPIADPIAGLNAVGVNNPNTPLLLDSQFTLTSPRWAVNGQIVFFRRVDLAATLSWHGVNVITRVPFSLDPAVEAVYGIPNGYLTRSQSSEIIAYDASQTSTPIWQPPPSSTAIIVWASPINSTFGPTSIYIPINLTGIVHCVGTPVSNVSIGKQGRITAGSSLRMRSSPGGEYVLTLDEGTEFLIVGGPQCQGTYTWWLLRLQSGTEGWAAEGERDYYYIEPVPDSN